MRPSLTVHHLKGYISGAVSLEGKGDGNYITQLYAEALRLISEGKSTDAEGVSLLFILPAAKSLDARPMSVGTSYAHARSRKRLRSSGRLGEIEWTRVGVSLIHE